ncbi:MAG: TIGR01777 family protein [Elusimicrobia bacterium RIFCSPLOWO2_01_FULL_54_10]|nr:MAG: TIGR01777 family protein [Elusimicrobia bacterium RIFCSPLOWO2_01_FULL_54_10]
MKILVSGSTGFVGRALVAALEKSGHQVFPLKRSAFETGLNAVILEGIDAVVHLAGESITGRWTADKKEKILKSRVEGTQRLAEILSGLSRPPKVFICASAIGYYGDRGEEILKEESSPGNLFLSQVCKEWEAACQPAAQKGIRSVNLRIGMILGRDGGALAKMLLPFKLGAGGIIGSGKQWMSWITLDDVIGVILHALKTETLSGPVNAGSPNPIINFGFTKTLGKALHRPTIFPMPAFAARLVFGQMADELLLASTRVEPAKLKASGYSFKYPSLEAASKNLL